PSARSARSVATMSLTPAGPFDADPPSFFEPPPPQAAPRSSRHRTTAVPRRLAICTTGPPGEAGNPAILRGHSPATPAIRAFLPPGNRTSRASGARPGVPVGVAKGATAGDRIDTSGRTVPRA